MKTKAAVLRNVGGPLIFEELEVPKPGKGQVLVKILYSGLCRSNINEIKGRKGADFIPHLTGHEASAVIMEVGDGVTKVKTDDYVVCSWIKGHGLEAPSVKYQGDKDVVNAGACSTFTEYAVISENRLIKIPVAVELIFASLLGCAIPTGAGIVDHYKMIRGQKLAVFGIGGVGASALLRAVSLGMDCVAFDIVPWKLQWATKELGVKTAHPDGFFENNYKNFFDFSIECSGNKSAMEYSFMSVKTSGTAIIAGNLKPGETIAIDPWQLMLGKTIDASGGWDSFLDTDVLFYGSLYIDGLLPIGKLVTKVYSFDQINESIRDLEEGKLIRGVVEI
ncbi:MAG TPA: alcohol dehydrogenase catalytic domain-containing protein [Candidatus Paceibacterota bacterium]